MGLVMRGLERFDNSRPDEDLALLNACLALEQELREQS
jgi:hypothetical protein